MKTYAVYYRKTNSRRKLRFAFKADGSVKDLFDLDEARDAARRLTDDSTIREVRIIEKV